MSLLELERNFSAFNILKLCYQIQRAFRAQEAVKSPYKFL